MNPFQLFNSVAQAYRIMQGDPTEINKLLLNKGAITQEQYNDVKGMSPSQTGQYLIKNGILGQQQVQQYSQMIPQAQQMLK